MCYPDYQRSVSRLPGSQKTLAEAVHQFTILGGEIVAEAINGFDDDSPLRQTGDGTEGVEPRLHLERDSHTELRIVLDLFTLPGSGWRSSGTTTRPATVCHS
jgi:hypothetical protein